MPSTKHGRVRLITVPELRALINQVGLSTIYQDLIAYLRDDLNRWQQFSLIPRMAQQTPIGVLELMPICDDRYYACKYVNGHPKNPQHGKQTVVAFGFWVEVATGYPLLLCEMTLLTALRTAATTALVADYCARANSQTIALIGCGAQSEFQVYAHTQVRSIQQVRYFDIDPKAMLKFAENIQTACPQLQLVPCSDIETTLIDADIIVTATADKRRAKILTDALIQPGVHIQALGGDTPGKTECDPSLLARSRLVVEYAVQTRVEGESQQLLQNVPVIELWELVQGQAQGRLHENDVTLFDSVGFALADYSALRLISDYCQRLGGGTWIPLLPDLPASQIKNLWSILY